MGVADNVVRAPAAARPPVQKAAAVTPLLDVSGVTLQYKTRDHLVTATYRVDFQVFTSDRFILLGPSGCGKSTLLKAVGGYMKPVEGHISLKGREIDRPGPERMMVFQEFDQLLPWKTVKQNVTFALTASGKSRSTAGRRRSPNSFGSGPYAIRSSAAAGGGSVSITSLFRVTSRS
jgi:NitT/TauT family transport system ATP-binding protein